MICDGIPRASYMTSESFMSFVGAVRVKPLTEIIRHKIPEIQILVHSPDMEFLIIIWSTRCSNLIEH